ncbi:SusD/RagB family nutrient-binding outer membrane lipoprotein [Persicobacter diffluens]|uniref:SusD/RagB family nutrient-binding outer membrane lipoprotein n=1 Tax=Persicobacter diffluens TaxID=981 RepID=A0AAN4W1F4_9BACT|nr:hypothetical protein PEDI_35080 [Persicobacter diffluens]
MKSYKNIAFGIGLSALSLMGCTKNFDEINTDPNEPDMVPTYSLFYNGTRVIMDESRGQWYGLRGSDIWMQYIGQRNYLDEDRYFYRESSVNGGWRELYLALNNLNEVIKIAEDEEHGYDFAEVYGNAHNQVQAARIFKAYTFQTLTENHGDIPYQSYSGENPDFQALGEHMFPVYAESADIYADMLEELKDAAAQIDESKPVFTDFDLIYFGNASNWKKLANSLRLRLAVRVKDSQELGAIAQQHIAELKANPAALIADNSENAAYHFEGNDIKGAPVYKAYYTGTQRTDFMLSQHLVDVLKGKAQKPNGDDYQNPFAGILDPRLFKFGAPGTTSKITEADMKAAIKANEHITAAPETYIGIPVGVADSVGQNLAQVASLPGTIRMQADFAEPIMSYAEVCFLLSEVNDWDDSWYAKGVAASLEQWHVNAEDAQTYIDQLPAATEASVLTQKYIAFYGQPNEAWAEYRRTGFPKTVYLPGEVAYVDDNGFEHTFQPQVVGQTNIPSRFRYPLDEFDLNGTNYLNAIEKRGGNDMMIPHFWAKK